ncbi:MAG: ankyrin repeat domain-containing protein [Elusimicrobiota bacterium]
MRLILAVSLLSAAAPSAYSKDCTPPVFYTSLPRDRDWYYGAGKAADAQEAREAALRSLSQQVTGDAQLWNLEQIKRIAGPGRDRARVAEGIGNVLPQSSLLAGWEQDDFEYKNCNGMSYAMVRIEKERVLKFVQSDAAFKQALADSLTRRVEKVEVGLAGATEDIKALMQRLNALEQRINRAPASDNLAHGELAQTVASIKLELNSGRASTRELAQKITETEDVTSILLDQDRVRLLDDAIGRDIVACVSAMLKYGVAADKSTMNNALLKAIDLGRTEIVKLLIENGADVNTRGPGTRKLSDKREDSHYAYHGALTPLMITAARGDVATAQLLLEAGADASLKDYDDHTAADWARNRRLSNLIIAGGSYSWGDDKSHDKARGEILELLSHPPSPTLTPRPLKGVALTGPEHQTIEQLLWGDRQALQHALRSGNQALAKRILENGPQHGLHFGVEDLRAAIWADNFETATALIKAGVNVNEPVPNTYVDDHWTVTSGKTFYLVGTTPLMYAAVDGHAGMIKLLIDHGADLNAVNAKGQSAFDLAPTPGIEALLRRR